MHKFYVVLFSFWGVAPRPHPTARWLLWLLFPWPQLFHPGGLGDGFSHCLIHNSSSNMRYGHLVWLLSWIWSNRKWHCSIRRPKKPHPRTKHEGLSDDALQSYGHLKFSQNVWIVSEVGRSSVVGRQYSYFLHWSHILLFCYVRDVACEE